MSTKIKGSCSEAGKEHNQSSQEIWMQKTYARVAGNLLVSFLLRRVMKKKKFDICRGSEIIMDYGLQELREQMKIAVTSRIPGFIFTNAEDRTKYFFFCMLDKIITNRTYTAKCRRSKFNIPRWILNCSDGY